LQQALYIVQPDTLLRWHRDLFRYYWSRESKSEKCEPRISPETIALIKQMASENQLWGAERIRGELLSVCTNAALKIIANGHQRIVDGLFVLGCGSETECFWCFSVGFFRIQSLAGSRTRAVAGMMAKTARKSYQNPMDSRSAFISVL
jgi:hypothetical protein